MHLASLFIVGSATWFGVYASSGCNADNCLRALRGTPASAATFCATYTTAVLTATTDLPTFLSPCSSSISRVSSACSCFVAQTTLSTATSASTSNTCPGPSTVTVTAPAVTSYFTETSDVYVTNTVTSVTVSVEVDTVTATETDDFTFTNTLTEDFTLTTTATETDDFTFTVTATETDTATTTETDDFTFTQTNTKTATETDDFTFTRTNTKTATQTDDFTFTKTNTATATATTTATVTTTSTTVLICNGSPTPTANVFVNPGFESGQLAPWVFTNNADDGTAFIPPTNPSIQATNPHSGTYDLYIHDDSGSQYDDFRLRQTVTVCPGQAYTFSFWALSLLPSECFLQLYSTTLGGSAFQFALSTSYQKFSIHIPATTGTSMTVGIEDTNCFGNLRVDDFQLAPA